MDLVKAVVLGVVQGLTEFLPISSSGHLVVVQDILGFSHPGVTFEILLHLGTAASVAWVFYPELLAMLAAVSRALRLRRPAGAGPDPHLKLVGMLALAGIPTALIGLGLKPWFERAFESVQVVGPGLWITAWLLWHGSRRMVGRRPLPGMRVIDALVIGLFQGLAITPGVSRSGATISAGLLLGLERQAAARFSFLLSLPAILVAVAVDLLDVARSGAAVPWGQAAVGMVAAALAGVFAIRVLLAFVQRGRLLPFAVYTAGLGTVLVAWSLLR